MTSAKPNHLKARRLLLQYLDLHPGRVVHDDLDPAEAGVVGDTAHAEGGDSYHLGKDKIRARAGRNRYSVDESARDARGLDGYASAMDIGYFEVKTSRGTFDLYDFNAWLLALCKAGDPDTADLREVIYSLDGETVRRWDDLGIRSGGDSSHTFHTHLSEYRDATGIRMVRLVTRWLQHIGLIPLEDDMTKTEFFAWMTEWSKSADGRADKVAQAVAVLTHDPGKDAAGKIKAGGVQNYADADGKNPTVAPAWALGRAQVATDLGYTNRTKLDQILAQLKALTGKDFTDEQAIIAGVLAGLDPALIAAAIPAELAQQVANELATRLAA